MTKEEIIRHIRSGGSFFCLQKPREIDASYFVLSENSDTRDKSLWMCPFNSKEIVKIPIENTHTGPLSHELLDWEVTPNLNAKTSTLQGEYVSWVESALTSFDSTFQKVVLARNFIAPYNQLGTGNRPFQLFNALHDTDTYRYILHINGYTWIGSSPELFLSLNNNTVTTMALAGTRPKGSLDEWGEKERDEQQIVADFITHQMAKLGCENIQTTGVYTRPNVQVEHLCTDISCDLKSHADLHQLATALHPTPALAGQPQNMALQFIAAHENFQRELYGGFIGLQDPSGTELFVNIRCAQYAQNGLCLYAGAGINAGSVPKLEWEETEQKLQTLLKAAKHQN